MRKERKEMTPYGNHRYKVDVTHEISSRDEMLAAFGGYIFKTLNYCRGIVREATRRNGC